MKRLNSEDIIDLELFIKSDELLSPEAKAARDFKIFESASERDKKDEISLLRHWISEMRALKTGVSKGRAAEGIFKALSAILFLLGMFLIGVPLANAFFVEAGSDGEINVSYFFFSCVLAQFILVLSAVFFAPRLAYFADFLASKILDAFFGARGGLMGLYSSNRSWFLLKGAFAAQCLGFGIVCGIFFTQLFRPAFNEYRYGWRTTLPNFITPARVHNFAKTVALPWSIFAGEGCGYPSLEQVEDSRIILDSPAADVSDNAGVSSQNSNDSSEAANAADGGEASKIGENTPKYEAWAVFFILSSLFYGVLARAAFLLWLKFKISRVFGPHRIRNDRRAAEILHRLAYASCNPALSAQTGGFGDVSSLAVLLRADLDPWHGSILEGVKKALSLPDAEIVSYNFGFELFEGAQREKIASKKNVAFVCLADDYNEEAFETIQNLVNAYPESFVSVYLLGRLSKADGAFRAPLPVEKSWWERKVNSISSRNLKLC